MLNEQQVLNVENIEAQTVFRLPENFKLTNGITVNIGFSFMPPAGEENGGLGKFGLRDDHPMIFVALSKNEDILHQATWNEIISSDSISLADGSLIDDLAIS